MITNNFKISIVDYGVGNLFSITNAVRSLEKNVQIVEDPTQIADSNAIIIPGVGSFKGGMSGLVIRNLIKPIVEYAKSKRPILGICLGAQLLMDKGYEFGECRGIGLVAGRVVKFSHLKNNEKIPHVGWNAIYPSEDNSIVWKDTILSSTQSGSDFYFVHSYIIETKNKKNILAYTNYGGRKFTSIIKKGNIYGCQFHPEKSGGAGLNLLNEFVQFAHNHKV